MYFVEGEVNEEWAMCRIETEAAIGVALGLLDDFIRGMKAGDTDQKLLDAFLLTRSHLREWTGVFMTEEQFQKMFNFRKDE